MARPLKQNASYFSHDADMRNNRKVKALRTRFGLEGYAVWCMMLECLTDENGFVLPWDALSIELISGDFGVEAEHLSNMVTYMVRIGLIELEEAIIRCPAHRERMQFVIDERERKRQWKQVNKAINDDENKVSDDENAQTKGKEIKGNKRKLKLPNGSVEPAHADDEDFEEKTAIGSNSPINHHADISEKIIRWNEADNFATLNAISKRAGYDPLKHGPIEDEISRFISSNLGKDSFRDKLINNPVQFFVEQFPGWLALPAAKNKLRPSPFIGKQEVSNAGFYTPAPTRSNDANYNLSIEQAKTLIHQHAPMFEDQFTEAHISKIRMRTDANTATLLILAIAKTLSEKSPNGGFSVTNNSGLTLSPNLGQA